VKLGKASPPVPKHELALLLNSQALLEFVRQMPLPEGRDGTRFLDGLKIFEEVVALGRSRMKQLLVENPHCVPHWRLFDGASVRELKGSGTKLREVLGEELSEEAFLDAGKWSFSQLETAYMDEHCVDRNTAALAIGRLLEQAGLVTIRTNAPSLKRV
jgi:hypothetical protein